MTKFKFDYKNFNIKDVQHCFNDNSVVQISNLFPKQLCSEACNFLINNEVDILNKFKHDPRSLVTEKVNFKEYIKYFSKPVEYEFDLFSKFLNSKIFELASKLLNDDVYIDRAELHSRYSNCSPIPPHQDNAYFGLKDAKSLTFYITLTNQNPEKGGLKYYATPIGSMQPHKASQINAFSLTTEKANFKNMEKIYPFYSVGDCTIHHSTSLHFADEVPSNTERVFALSVRMHSLNDFQEDSHKIWYEKIVSKNRNKLK